VHTIPNSRFMIIHVKKFFWYIWHLMICNLLESNLRKGDLLGDVPQNWTLNNKNSIYFGPFILYQVLLIMDKSSLKYIEFLLFSVQCCGMSPGVYLLFINSLYILFLPVSFSVHSHLITLCISSGNVFFF
jgi:hypothetical protein